MGILTYDLFLICTLRTIGGNHEVTNEKINGSMY